LPTAMNGQPAALSYLRTESGRDGASVRYTAICLTVMTLDRHGRVVDLTVFARPELFAAFGFAQTIEDA
jgi:hypothetical protein